jgi:Type VI secretion system, TssO
MPPLNQAERRKAFLNFLILFSVTVTIITVVIFFSIEVPFKDNRRLRNQVAEYQDQSDLNRSLNTEITDASNLISSTMDVRNVNPAAVNASIDQKIRSINNHIAGIKDSIAANYYTVLVRNLESWRAVKKESGEIKNNAQETAMLNQEIAILKTQLAEKDRLIVELTRRP